MTRSRRVPDLKTGSFSELRAQRPKHIHAKSWLLILAKREVTTTGSDFGDPCGGKHQAWQQRVSVVFHRMLREAGIKVEGAA